MSFFLRILVLATAALSAVVAPSSAFDAPGPNTVGLVWVEDRFWASDKDTGKIHFQNDAGDGWVEWQTWPGTPLAWDDVGLWVVDEAAGQIVRLDPGTDTLTRTGVIQIPEAALREVPSIKGLTWDGSALWLATGCGLCSKLFRVDPANGDVLQSFFPVCEPRGIAYAHEHPALPRRLWTIAYNGPHKRALLSARTITADPSLVGSSQKFYKMGLGTATQYPEDPTAIAVHDGLWIVDRTTRAIELYDPSPVTP